MKKFMKSFVIVAVVVIALGSASAVFAQTGTAQGSGPGAGYGRGASNDRGGRGAMLDQNRVQLEDELLHDEFVTAFSDVLNLSVDEINTRLDDGETLMQIILSTGLSFDEGRTLIDDVRTQVLEQAVLDGIITQEQADWMLTRMGGQAYMGGMGSANGMRGAGQRLYGTGNCPYTTTD